jgi:hypothetical protein
MNPHDDRYSARFDPDDTATALQREPGPEPVYRMVQVPEANLNARRAAERQAIRIMEAAARHARATGNFVLQDELTAAIEKLYAFAKG